MLRTWLLVVSAIATVGLLSTAVSRQTNYTCHRLYKSMTTRKDDHSELVEVLTELLRLLDDLVAIEPNTLLYPQPDTGLHVPGNINATAASVAGYSTQAITLMPSLSYLRHSDVQVGPNTHMVAYASQDEGGFDEERIMYVESGEEYMHPSAVQLTSGERIYGLWRIYDIDKTKTTSHPLKPHQTYTL